MAQHVELNATMAALADPTRRAILARLGQADARVTDIARDFPIALNSVSKHIRVLEHCGLVRRRVVGREHLLSLNPRPFDEIARWLETQRNAWQARLSAMDTMLRSRAPARDRSSRSPRPDRAPANDQPSTHPRPQADDVGAKRKRTLGGRKSNSKRVGKRDGKANA